MENKKKALGITRFGAARSEEELQPQVLKPLGNVT